MYTVIIVNVSAVYLAYLAKYQKFGNGLKASFFLIFVFLAFRYDYGNDYQSYLSGFLEINLYEEINLFDGSLYFEPGWVIINKIFEPLGFFWLIAVLAAFNCFVFYHFIAKYVPIKYYWLAVFLYVFNPSFMLIHSSAMRQSVAVSLFLLGLGYLKERKPLNFCFLILLASFFHTSALILLPIYFINFINWRINRISMITILSVFVILFFIGAQIQPIINEFISQYFEKYGRYDGEARIGTGIGIVVSLLFLGSLLYYEKFQSEDQRSLFKIGILSFMIIPLSLIIDLITRIGLYFEPVVIAVYPLILFRMKEVLVKSAFVLLIIIYNLFIFYVFFTSDVFGEYFANYKTIFSAPHFY